MLIQGYPKGSDITLLNTRYHYPRKDPETNKWDDGSIELIVKDNVTGEKFVEVIENPTYEYYMAKDDVMITHHMLTLPIEKCDKISVPFKDLLYDIAERTGNLNFYFDNIKSGNRYNNTVLHTHDRVLLSDMNIEDHYRFRFSNEYTNRLIPINKAYFDIEVDTINMVGDFPEPGECPVNAISMLDEQTTTEYVFLLRNENNPQIAEFEEYANTEQAEKDVHDFIVDAVGGWKQATRMGVMDIQYKFFFFTDEIKLLGMFFKLVNTLKPDFLLAWNMAFDVPYIIARIETLGYDPTSVMCDKSFVTKEAMYVIDERNKNEPEQRGDYAAISSPIVYMDQLIQYASRRKGQGTIVSYALDDIGKKEAGVRKLNYKDITTSLSKLPYVNYKIFVFYNIMDVIVQKCIEAKTGDIDFVFNKALVNNTRYSKVHRQTVYLINRLASHCFKKGLILGNNVNKNNSPKHFTGAFVADPTLVSDYSKMKQNGYALNIFNNLNDFDYKRLYPSIIQEFNMAPNTIIAKLFFPEQIDMNENKHENPIWERQMQYMEDLQSGNYLEFCHRWLHLASYAELLQDIMEYFTTVKPSYEPINLYRNDGKLNAFYHLPKTQYTINPFIHITGEKEIRPAFIHIVPELDVKLKGDILNVLQQDDQNK